jgi:hypothetical protein
MKRLRVFMLIGMVAMVVATSLLATAHAARAQVSAAPSASYSISWYTVDGGGGTSSSGGYTLTGTAGQPDAGSLHSASSSYTLGGGFWASFAGELQKLFLPLVRR